MSDDKLVERAHYYVSGVVVTTATPAYFQIMEEIATDYLALAEKERLL